MASLASSSNFGSRNSMNGGSDGDVCTLPLGRRRRLSARREREFYSDRVSWLSRFRANPLITGLIGIAHVVGLQRVATTMSRMGSFAGGGDDSFDLDLDDTLDDTLDERDYPDGADLVDDGFGFYIAITPPTSRPSSIDCRDGDAPSCFGPPKGIPRR